MEHLAESWRMGASCLPAAALPTPLHRPTQGLMDPTERLSPAHGRRAGPPPGADFPPCPLSAGGLHSLQGRCRPQASS